MIIRMSIITDERLGLFSTVCHDDSTVYGTELVAMRLSLPVFYAYFTDLDPANISHIRIQLIYLNIRI